MALQVWYISMAFPIPSETFATTEVAALLRHGVNMSVHNLRPAHKDAQQMLVERGLADLPISHGSIANQLKGLLLCVIHPILSLTLFVWVVRYTLRRPIHFLASFLCFPRTVQLFLQARRERPQIVHLYWGHYPSLLGLLISKYIRDIVLTTSLSAYDLVMEYGCSRPLLKQAYFVRTWARANIPHIERLGAPRDRIVVYYQCLSFANVKQSDYSKISGRIVSAGRLIRVKGMHKVLEAFRMIHEVIPHSTLVISGDGPERVSLQRLAKKWEIDKASHFTGHIAQRQLFDELGQAQVFLFLSEHAAERVPNVVKEAMAAGCVCVVSRTIGIQEVVECDKTGYIVDSNPISAAQMIIKILRAFELQKKLVNEGIAHSRATFSCEAIIPEFIDNWSKGLKQIRTVR